MSEETPQHESGAQPAEQHAGQLAPVHVKGPRWKKFSITTFLIVIVLHVLFGIGAGFWVVAVYLPRQKQFAAGVPKTPGPPKEVQHSVQMAKKKNTMSAPAMPKRVTVNSALAKVALPAMPVMPVSDSVQPTKIAGYGGQGMGPGMGFGGGIGSIGSGGSGPFSLPKIMADRCSPVARQRAMKETGGKPTSEEAVKKALAFLKTKQNADGSFGSGSKGAMTGFALLSFLGHCEIESDEYKATVAKAIDRLCEEANKKEGNLSFSGGSKVNVYQHAIATYALGESYSLTRPTDTQRRKQIENALRAAVAIILKGQRPDGSWGGSDPDKDQSYSYHLTSHPDLSVTAWQVQALKAAHYTGLNIDGVDKALDKAIGWIMKDQDPRSGLFGYGSPNDAAAPSKEDPSVPAHRLTGAGVLCLQVWPRGGGTARAQHGVRSILAGPKFNYTAPTANLYAWYYETQACINAGGEHWKKWNDMYQDELVKHQAENGSWPVTGGKISWASGGFGGNDGEIYRTALCTLMLEVYYRYLPSTKSAGLTSG